MASSEAVANTSPPGKNLKNPLRTSYCLMLGVPQKTAILGVGRVTWGVGGGGRKCIL